MSIVGPGVAGQTTAFVPLDTVSVHAFTAANSMPPCGVDLLVVTANCVIGLPRSVMVALHSREMDGA